MPEMGDAVIWPETEIAIKFMTRESRYAFAGGCPDTGGPDEHDIVSWQRSVYCTVTMWI